MLPRFAFLEPIAGRFGARVMTPSGQKIAVPREMFCQNRSKDITCAIAALLGTRTNLWLPFPFRIAPADGKEKGWS
jgi:hypothetical protein